jgi:abhydrolase domain-containing protein 2
MIWYLDAKMIDLSQLPGSFSPDYWPEPFWPITVVFAIWLINFLKIFSYPEEPKVYLNEKSKNGNHIKDVLDKCPIMKEKYYPCLLWGKNGHIQTATYGILGHSTLKRTFDRRHAVKLDDGTTVIFDVFEPIESHPTGNDYTFVLCPGIANTSESNYIRTLVHSAQENGYRCAVLNHLGALKDVQLTSDHIFNYGSTAELEAMMKVVAETYPLTKFISIGFSMGGNVTTRYLAKAPEEIKKRILLGLSVGQGYCATASGPCYHEWENGRRVYNYIITENMKRLLRRNYDKVVLPHVKTGLVDEQRLWGATSLVVLDEVYNRRVFGFNSVDDFYKSVSSLSLIPNITVPMIFLNALDDPIVPEVLWNPVKELCESHPLHTFILLKHGGHLGFLEGKSIKPNSVTWLDRFILQLSEATIQIFDE